MGSAAAEEPEACALKVFRTEQGTVYLRAETKYDNEEYAAAQAEIDTLLAMDLNCYERSAVLMLAACVEAETGEAAEGEKDAASSEFSCPGSYELIEEEPMPIGPPDVSYPLKAMEQGLEADCEVRFDVDISGKPFNISAVCTDPVFVQEAERAVASLEFAPKIVRGAPVERLGVVYPIRFELGD